MQIRSVAGVANLNADQGNVSGVANLIFGRYVWIFEATSALLITAALGAMVLAHRERLGRKLGQRDWSRRRFATTNADGSPRVPANLAGLPVPGVYARHNSVDTPALLPDGTPSELSISRVLTARGPGGRARPLRSRPNARAAREIEEGSER